MDAALTALSDVKSASEGKQHRNNKLRKGSNHPHHHYTHLDSNNDRHHHETPTLPKTSTALFKKAFSVSKPDHSITYIVIISFFYIYIYIYIITSAVISWHSAIFR